MVSFPTLLADAAFNAGAAAGTYLTLGDQTRGLLGTGTLGPAGEVWTDISSYVHGATVNRGSNRVTSPILTYEAGTATIVLRNSDARFDPSNLSGPYVAAGATQVTPMRAARLRASWNGATYDLWRGFADSWELGYIPPSYSVCTMQGTDAFKVFASISRVAGGSVGSGGDSGARISRILNSANWPATDRLVATGDTLVQATTLDGEVLSEMQTVAATEIGDLYMDGAGRVVYRNRQAALEELRSARPAALFGDGFDQSGVAQSTINLCTNPSAETAITGWLGGGAVGHSPTLALDSTHAQFGTQAVLATWATATGGDLPLVQMPTFTGLIPGRTYTFSVYAYVPSGSPAVFAVVAGTAFGTSTGSTTDAWVRLSVTTQVTSSSALLQVWPVNSVSTAGQQVWLDGAQGEEGGTATTYCDGDQSGAEWDGTAHASTSRRLVELPYTTVTPDYDDTTMVNLVRATRVGGAVQTAEDTTAQALYLTRTLDRSDLIMTADSDALNWANWVLYQSKDPELRFSQIVINPLRDPSRLFPQVLGREIGDRIRIRQRPPGGGTVTRDVFIRGIAHDIDCKRRTWTTTWTLQSATKYAFFTLGSTTLGVLDANALAW